MRFLDAVTLFYVLYVAFEIPCSIVFKKFRASMPPRPRFLNPIT
jgi:hypothetical protein